MGMAHGTDLSQRKSKPDDQLRSYSDDEIKDNLGQLDGWSYSNGEIWKAFHFDSYYETSSFVNAIVWIAQRENHHPSIHFDFKFCRVAYSTHAVNGISENDFICAAKIDALFKS